VHHHVLTDRSSYLLRHRFRWVFCQLEVLRHCLPASIRQTLDHLPESLDDTYLQVLRQIPQANQAHAHRMLQCLLVAVRPLRVEELAEVLAFKFDAAQGGVPKYCAAWQLDDQTQAVLSTCSSLVTIVNEGRYGPQVAQFSHFSVKEFLMSNRLGAFSQYSIHHLSAHTILTWACLGVLLHFDDNGDTKCVQGLPLANYAARHWVEHAQFQGVPSLVQDGMETLFDSGKPHFTAWIGIYDLDKVNAKSLAGIPNPLYYSARCGFYDLVKHLAVKHPQHVNAICGRYELPLLAALSEGHFEVAELLLKHGANIEARETAGMTPLLRVLSWRQPNFIDTVTFLLEHKAKINSRDSSGKTPLLVLLEDRDENNILHPARLLLQHGAEVNRGDTDLKSPLFLALVWNWFKLSRILLDNGADVNAENNGKTLVNMLSDCSMYDYHDLLNGVELLLEYDTELNRHEKNKQTPLHLAVGRHLFKLARILLEHGAHANAVNIDGMTPLHLLLENRDGGGLDLFWMLLDHGAPVNGRDKNNQTPLLLAMEWDRFNLARILLEHGADANVENNNRKTPLHLLSESRIHDEGDALCLTWLLLEQGAPVNGKDKCKQTPLLLAIGRDWFKLARILLEHGADANVENDNKKTPLHLLSESQTHDEGEALDLFWLLLERGTIVDGRDKKGQTPLHQAMGRDWFKLARILLEHGADANVEDDNKKTPLHLLSESQTHDEGEALDLFWLLLERGTIVDGRDRKGQTPLHQAMGRDWFKLARILLEHGSDANVEDHNGRTPLHILSERQIYYKKEVGNVLNHTRSWASHGADVNSRCKDKKTPSLLEKGTEMYKYAWNLLSLMQIPPWKTKQARPQ
jgi:ankyrin repeat protein